MRKSLLLVLIVILVVLYASLFVVTEGQRGIVLRFGKVLRDDENKPLVYAPGLHLKYRSLNLSKCWMRVSRLWITKLTVS